MRKTLLTGTLAVLSFACAAPRAAAPSPAPLAEAPIASRPEMPARIAAPIAEALPFIENDYSRALAEAKVSGRPVFVDVWAPW